MNDGIIVIYIDLHRFTGMPNVYNTLLMFVNCVLVIHIYEQNFTGVDNIYEQVINICEHCRILRIWAPMNNMYEHLQIIYVNYVSIDIHFTFMSIILLVWISYMNTW